MLYIELVQYTPDGRSVIKTKGERRFEIQDIRMYDGLHMATIEFIADEPTTDGKFNSIFFKNLPCDHLVALLKKTENEVYQLAKKWFAALSNATKVRTNVSQYLNYLVNKKGIFTKNYLQKAFLQTITQIEARVFK